MLATARQMCSKDSRIKFLLPVASTLDVEEISQLCADPDLDILVSDENLYDLIGCCDAIVSCSGTVTLEIALLGVPMCIVYKMSWLSYQIMRRMITIPYIGLVNIVADKDIVREFLQAQASADTISGELFELLENQDYRNQVIADLEGIKENLGEGDGARNMAQLVLSLLPANSESFDKRENR
jgi:lipid-A-disaccharide synthase